MNIGAFNAGIYIFFELDVFSLDGVVNPEALSALKNGDIANYVHKKNIGYLIEQRQKLKHRQVTPSLGVKFLY